MCNSYCAFCNQPVFMGESMLNLILEEESVWHFLKYTTKPIIMYGMGNGGDKVLNEFAVQNIKCVEVIASDAFVRGQSFRGYTVKRLADVEEKYNDFVIVVAFASSLDNVMNNIFSIANKHITLIPGVPVFGSELVDDEFFNIYADNINRAYSLLADQQSKNVFIGALNFYYSGKIKYLTDITTAKSEAFNSILKLGSAENYLDLGAYRGDTIEELLHYTNNQYSTITALEPDKKTFNKLISFAEGMKNTELINKGIWNTNTTMLFSNKGGRNSTLNTKTGIEINVTAVDTICKQCGFSYIKMDVEGAEAKAIEGAVNTLIKFKPKLNIAVYHTFADLFNIILQINDINSSYKFYLRHHPYIPCWDTNLYCI